MNAEVKLPKLLTEQEVCDYLGITIHTLRHWRRTRQIEFIKINRQIRFYESTIISLLEQGTQNVG